MRQFILSLCIFLIWASTAQANSLTLYGTTNCPSNWEKVFEGYVPHHSNRSLYHLYNSGGGEWREDYKFSNTCSKTITKGVGNRNFGTAYGIKCAVCILDSATTGAP